MTTATVSDRVERFAKWFTGQSKANQAFVGALAVLAFLAVARLGYLAVHGYEPPSAPAPMTAYEKEAATMKAACEALWGDHDHRISHEGYRQCLRDMTACAWSADCMRHEGETIPGLRHD